MTVIFHTLFLMIVYLLQAHVLPFVNALTTIPLVLPLAAVAVAMNEGGARGAVFGLVSGALCDLSFHKPIAGFMLLLCAVCMIIGVLSDTVVARGFLSYLFLCVATLMLCGLAQMFALLVFEGAPFYALVMAGVRQGLVSLPFCIILYPVARVMDKRAVRDYSS
jgi:cell shape-determining protein MreD